MISVLSATKILCLRYYKFRPVILALEVVAWVAMNSNFLIKFPACNHSLGQNHG